MSHCLFMEMRICVTDYLSELLNPPIKSCAMSLTFREGHKFTVKSEVNKLDPLEGRPRVPGTRLAVVTVGTWIDSEAPPTVCVVIVQEGRGRILFASVHLLHIVPSLPWPWTAPYPGLHSPLQCVLVMGMENRQGVCIDIDPLPLFQKQFK